MAAMGVASALCAGTAGADPKSGEVFPLDCDNGETYTVVVKGNGEFTPGHDLDSTTVLVPVSFGEFTGTVTDPDGNVVDTITEPEAAKGESAEGLEDPVTCTFSTSFEDDGLTFTFSGSVVGRVTPGR
jgi:hypothetical protein